MICNLAAIVCLAMPVGYMVMPEPQKPQAVTAQAQAESFNPPGGGAPQETKGGGSR